MHITINIESIQVEGYMGTMALEVLNPQKYQTTSDYIEEPHKIMI